MKKLGKVLLIILAVVVALALALYAYLLVVYNHHFLFDLRAGAPAATRYVTVTQVEEGTRVEFYDSYVNMQRKNGHNPAVPYVIFNDDREIVKAIGITPIDFDRKNCWGLWSYEDFVAEYGRYHKDIGDNIFWPAWITNDGYLITMWAAGEKVWSFCLSDYGEFSFTDLLATPE